MFMAKRTRSTFTPAYKAGAVRLAQTANGNIVGTVRDLGIDVTTLRDWCRQASTEEPDVSSLRHRSATVSYRMSSAVRPTAGRPVMNGQGDP